MLKIVVLIGLVALASAEKARYDNYKVLRIIPKNKEQLNILNQLENYQGSYEFWRGPSFVNQPADLMVAPSQLAELTDYLKSKRLAYNVYVNNVQELIDNENPLENHNKQQQQQQEQEGGSPSFDFKSYHSIEEIHAWLDSLGEKYPEEVEVIVAGKSYEGRELKGVKLSLGKEKKEKKKPGVFIEAGIHAREWISPATATYIIDALLTSQEPSVRRLAESYEWYIVPSVNPDGYAYTKKNRLWRKTRSPGNGYCMGADANRNWDYMWMKAGASSDPCAETYAGKVAFSEVETKTLSNYIKSVSDNLVVYLSFHSYSQLLLFPYGHTEEHLENYDDLYQIAEKSAEALEKRYGTEYIYGNIAETIYLASGSSIDYAKAVLKVPITYTYEFRDTGRHGFLLPADQIIPNSEEILDSLVAMFEEVARLGYPKKSH